VIFLHKKRTRLHEKVDGFIHAKAGIKKTSNCIMDVKTKYSYLF